MRRSGLLKAALKSFATKTFSARTATSLTAVIVSTTVLTTISTTAYADIDREFFIDQLDSANCSQVPPEIYLDTHSQTYDLANALSLSWISLTTLEDTAISKEELSDSWNVSNIKVIENAEHDLKIMIADYQDTVLVTFRHTDSNKNWLYNADYGLWDFDASFTLGEKTHHGFSRMLSAEWDSLLTEVSNRTSLNKKLFVFGHSLGAALAQLSAAGFQNSGINVDQVYLTGSPKVASKAWVEKADNLLSGRVYRLSYENDLIARLPIHKEALDEFRTIFSIVPNFVANMIGGARSNMEFDALGQQVSLNQYGSHTVWSPSDTASLEENYWLDMSDDLAAAKNSSWNPITQINRMVGVVSDNLGNHLLRSENGYFCAMIEALETE